MPPVAQPGERWDHGSTLAMFVGARTAPRGIRGVGGERDVQTSSCVVLPLLFARVMTEVIPPDDELDGKEFFAQWTAA